MSSKGGRIKRSKNVRNLDSDDAPSLAQSILDEQPNIMPAGRQLEKTPPSKSERVTTSPPANQMILLHQNKWSKMSHVAR